MVRLSGEEYETVAAAAAGAGLTVTAYVGKRAVEVARGAVSPLPSRTADVVRELVEQRRQLVRYGQLLTRR